MSAVAAAYYYESRSMRTDGCAMKVEEDSEWPSLLVHEPYIAMPLSLMCYNVRIPLLIPFTTSFGTTAVRDALIFDLYDGNIHAYSESVTSPIPDYGYEDNTTVMHIVKDFLSDQILDLPEPSEFVNRVTNIKGHNMAKAAMEMLLWDYHSKLKGVPLHKALGESRGYAGVGVSIGMTSRDNLLKLVGEALAKGYKRIKVKIEKGRETDILSSVRERFPDIPLSADANCGYDMNDVEILKKIDRYDLEYLEQPLGRNDIVEHSRLARELSTPLCLDESIESGHDAEIALETGACNIINIKPGRVGGLTESLRIAKIAKERNGHTWIGGMLETGIGRAFNVSMASCSVIDFPGDTSPNERYFSKDIVKNPFTMKSGAITPSEGAGTGVIVDMEELARRTYSKAALL